MAAPSEGGVDGAGAASVSAVAASSTTLVVPSTILDALLSDDAALEAEAVKKVRTMMAPAENVDALPNTAVTKLVRIIR